MQHNHKNINKMKAQELKIGNLITTKKFETDSNYRTYKVTAIEMINEVGYVSVNNFRKEDKFIEPIPLTIDILKLIPNFKHFTDDSFHCIIDENFNNTRELELIYINESWILILKKILKSGEFQSIRICSNIKYVYQLQNIFSDTFQVELDINNLL